MAKVQDSYYFDTFSACAEDACRAAHLLEAMMQNFQPANIRQELDEIHKIEHSADTKKHEMQSVLVKAFITPIEREDISALSTNIDTLTDKIEEVCMRVYIHNIQSIRPDAINMLDVVIRGCEEVCKMLEEFADFRHSKKLKEYIIHINSLEEESDRLFIANMRQLHVEPGLDIREIMAWEEIYTYLEKCADACEEIADSVENVVMKNS